MTKKSAEFNSAKFASNMQSLLKSVPANIEIVVQRGVLSVCKRGTLNKCIQANDNSDPVDNSMENVFHSSLRPYSESV